MRSICGTLARSLRRKRLRSRRGVPRFLRGRRKSETPRRRVRIAAMAKAGAEPLYVIDLKSHPVAPAHKATGGSLGCRQLSTCDADVDFRRPVLLHGPVPALPDCRERYEFRGGFALASSSLPPSSSKSASGQKRRSGIRSSKFRLRIEIGTRCLRSVKLAMSVITHDAP